MSAMTNECARCGATLAEYQAREDLVVCVTCDRDICAESYRSVANQLAAASTERDTLRSALSESARTIDAQEGRIQELLASFVRMTRETPYPEEDRAASVLIAEVGTLRAALATALTKRDEARSWLAKAREEVDTLQAQLAAAQAAALVEHAELNGYIDTAREAHDCLVAQAQRLGDPTGKLDDFQRAVCIVIEQCDLQRRRANWFEAAHVAGKGKLVERIERDTAEAIAAWLCGLTADTPMNRRDFGCQQERVEAVAKMFAADIRANAWRSK